MRFFADAFGLRDDMRIIDVGGRKTNWCLIEEKPDVTIVNIEFGDAEDGRFHYVHTDGKNLPYADNSFELCYSNSVIEHVGDWDAREAMAREIRRVASRYYVQTPNKWFFSDPHTVGAFLHWLPKRYHRKLVRWCTLWGLVDRPSQEQIDALLEEVELLTEREMRALFPDAQIVKERFLGMTKSIIALRL
jgi:ubiquinone/menaquinone biosynthesis C-methylase UbiE